MAFYKPDFLPEHSGLAPTLQETLELDLGSIITFLKIYGLAGDTSFSFPYLSHTSDLMQHPLFETLAVYCANKGMRCQLSQTNRQLVLMIATSPRQLAPIRAA